MKRGFTFAEMLLAISIMVILLGVTVGVFSSYRGVGRVEKNASRVRAMLEEARANTLAAQNDAQFGVHFTGSDATLFQGTSYSGGTTISHVTLDSQVTLSSTLNGGGSDVVFEKISGSTSQFGTTTLNDNGVIQYVIIYKTGFIEIK